MNVSILTLFPELFEAFLATSIIKRAIDEKFVNFYLYNLLDAVETKVRVDAHTVGPGPGMVIKPEVLDRGIEACEKHFGPGIKIFFSPQGKVLTQTLLRSFLDGGFVALLKNKNIAAGLASQEESLVSEEPKVHLILVCLRYEGTDYRAEEEFADIFLSLGDYVLMGGELPAQVFLESFVRLIPGVLGNMASSKEDSFETPFFDHPSYCKPDVWKNRKIPDILLSGNHAGINKWRLLQAAEKTLYQRFDWFRKHKKALGFQDLAQELIPPHYCVIMHDDILNKEGLLGTTSIKSIDLHDISRSASSYGIKKFFVVQPLKDQQEIAKEFFSFWTSSVGQQYNGTRCEAVEKIGICDSLEQVLAKIGELEGKSAVLVATSAKEVQDRVSITYHDQEIVWRRQRPVLLIFGTGYGLSPELIAKCDFVLAPIRGLPQYNHLSVRAAAAIVFDRWLGINPS